MLEIAELRGRQGAAAFCGKQLARWGAEVVRVDPPDASEYETRAECEFLHGGKPATFRDQLKRIRTEVELIPQATSDFLRDAAKSVDDAIANQLIKRSRMAF